MGLWARSTRTRRMASQSAMGNRPEEFDRLLASDGKAKRKEAFDENKAKLQYLPDYEKNGFGSFAKICDHNGRIMKARLKKGIWCVQPTHHSPR